MGQFYIPSNIDTKEHLVIEGDYWRKLMEVSWLNYSYVNSIINLLKDKWFNTRLVFCGDYAENNNYKLGQEITSTLATDDEVENNIKHFVLVNLDKHIYCQMDCCPESYNGSKIHPLPLLIADGNGDYFEEDDYDKVGSWAYDYIGVLPKTDKRLKEMKEVTYHFKE